MISYIFLETNGISVSSVVQFVKLAYNYENWDTFDALADGVISELKNYPDDLNLQQESKILQLLKSLSVVNTARMKKKLVMLKTDENADTINLTKSCKLIFLFKKYLSYFVFCFRFCFFMILQKNLSGINKNNVQSIFLLHTHFFLVF